MENEQKILEGTPENPITLMQTQQNPDGSRTEAVYDARTGKGHLTRFDTQGQVVDTVFGTIGSVSQAPGASAAPDVPGVDVPGVSDVPRNLPLNNVSSPGPRRWRFGLAIAVTTAAIQILAVLLDLLSILVMVTLGTCSSAFVIRKILGAVCAAALVVLMLRFRKDQVAGVLLAVMALLQLSLGLALTLTGVLNVLVAVLMGVMALDCFVELPLSPGLKKLLFGCGHGALVLAVVLVGTIQRIAIYNSVNIALTGAILLSELLSTAQNLFSVAPRILMGFAVAGAKEVP